MKTNNDYIYIYNYHQANFYIKNDVKLVSVGLNKTTNKIYFVFDKEESLECYIKWINREKNKVLNS